MINNPTLGNASQVNISNKKYISIELFIILKNWKQNLRNGLPNYNLYLDKYMTYVDT